MKTIRDRVRALARRQHGAVAVWQLRRFLTPTQTGNALRGWRRVHKGVCALGDLDELGWLMAAALSFGPRAAISHVSALRLLGLRPWAPDDIHVSVLGYGGRARRDGITVHRRLAFEAGTYSEVPVTSPTQSLLDAHLRPHELYRALEECDRQELDVDRARFDPAVVKLRRTVSGRTRSDTEAALLILLAPHLAELPRVNHILNGYETDFHWRRAGLVVEVDGFHHHREREPFARDRRSGLVHRIAGFEVVRVDADDVYDDPRLVIDALRAAAPSIFSGSGRAWRAAAAGRRAA